MARNEIIIRSDKGGQRTKTSAVGSVRNVISRSGGQGSSGSGVKNLAKGLRTVRTADFGSFGLFGGGKGATATLVQEIVKVVNKTADIVLDIQIARTGEHVKYGNIKKLKGVILNPSQAMIDATYGEWLRDMTIKRENIKNEYYRNLTGNLMYGKQYGDKR